MKIATKYLRRERGGRLTGKIREDKAILLLGREIKGNWGRS